MSRVDPLIHIPLLYLFFSLFFNDTASTEIYTLSLHDALPIYLDPGSRRDQRRPVHDPGARSRRSLRGAGDEPQRPGRGDRKSTRLNSSHTVISYAVFCLKKKKTRILRLPSVAISWKHGTSEGK